MPFGVDPTRSHADGLFVVPKSAFAKDTGCFESFYVAHMLDKHGYQNTWYDALNMDEENHLYFFTPPKTEGNLYFTVETYYQDIVPEQCI